MNKKQNSVTPNSAKPKLEDVLFAKICPYCGLQPDFMESSEKIYGKDYGPVYICHDCDAYVGVHKDGLNRPLGRLADAELRKAKKEAHFYFDFLWRKKMSKGFTKHEARKTAYLWLSLKMAIIPDHTHIGMFNIEQCKQVIELCKPYKK